MKYSNQRIWITGIVQGVGFRPFVYNLAQSLGLSGWVSNTSSGVEIEVSGNSDQIDQFTTRLTYNPPPLSHIDNVKMEPLPYSPFENFKIHKSTDLPTSFIPVSPDVAICADCRRELDNPSDRRYRYPFINCTNCGPRFTITSQIPYDRPNTSMAAFPMCPDCEQEYHNPADRRFHAQPIACPACGPKVWFLAQGEKLAESEEAIQLARQWLQEGKIIAIKGLGGFHLACDALNPTAVETLRRRKKRSGKPFALMAPDKETIKRFARLSEQEEKILSSPQAPIVLLDPLGSSKDLKQICAPNQSRIGFFLPYTPLHVLIIKPAPKYPKVLIMTSGNLSEEPIAYQNEGALSQLKHLADAFLMHDRPILMRTDDSVVTFLNHAPCFIRRARGYAPDPIRLPFDVPPILGAGPLLKNTFCLTRDRYAFISHFIGDLENEETLDSYEAGIKHYENLFRIHPTLIACDMHPDYLSTRYAQTRSQDENIPLIFIQHHHAHIAACLAENSWDSLEPVIGLSFDGTGYGTDDHIWGSEILIASYSEFQRRFHLSEVPMPGGETAVRKPARMAVSHLLSAGMALDPDLPPFKALSQTELDVIRYQMDNYINTPLTTSMGRLFDAVSSLIGIRHEITYEGQAAIELEAAADPDDHGSYNLEIEGENITTIALFRQILNDIKQGVPAAVISAKFHQAVIQLSLQACLQIKYETGIADVALSGGVWQNIYLMKRILPVLEKAGFNVLIHRQLPTNDSCISLGQAVIAASQERK